MLSVEPDVTASLLVADPQFDSLNAIEKLARRRSGSVSTASSSTLFPDAPDGGYGWFVVLGAFFVHFIADGVSFSFGILYPKIQSHFNAGKGESAMVGALFLSLPLLAGPLAAALIDHFGCRPMTIAAGIISCFGFIASIFAPSLPVLYVTFGLIAGTGLSLAFNAALVSVTYYFEEKRAFATGLTVCGSGLGTFVFAPFIEFLLNFYGWKGSLLILSGFLLNICVCGALIRDLPWPEDSLEYKRDKFLRNMQKHKDTDRTSCGKLSEPNLANFWPTVVPLNRCNSMVCIPTYWRDRSATQSSILSTNVQQDKRSKSVGTCLLKLAQSEKPNPDLAHLDLPDPPVQPSVCQKRRQRFASCTSYSAEPIGELEESNTPPRSPSKWMSVDIGDLHSNSPKIEERAKFRISNATLLSSGDEKEIELIKNVEETEKSENIGNGDAVLSDPVITNHKSLDDSKPQRSAVGFARRQPQRMRMRISSRVTGYPYPLVHFTPISARVPSAPALLRSRRKRHPSGAARLKRLFDDCVDGLKENGALLRSVSYCLFLMSNFLLYTFYDIPYVNLPEDAVHRLKISRKHSSFLISVIGIVNTFGMILYGAFADQKWVNKVLVYGSSMILCGFCVLIIPWIHSYWMLNMICGLFGLFISANYVLASVMLVDLLSLSDFTPALGWLSLVEGFGTLAGPPLAGYLYDWTGSYLATFVTGGIGIIISGILVIFIELFQCYKSQRRKSRIAA